MSERLDAVRQLLDLFKLERMAYLTVTVCAVIILLISAVRLLKDPAGSAVAASGLFGSAGVIAGTVGLLLRMWNQAFKAVLDAVPEEKDGDA